VPYFRDISDQADSVQAEQAQPTLQALGSGLQLAPIMNRESGLASTALAAVIIGAVRRPWKASCPNWPSAGRNSAR